MNLRPRRSTRLSYPSKSRVARRVRVAVFPAVCQGADSPHATLRRPRPCPPFVVPWRPATCCDRLSWSARPIAGSDRSYVTSGPIRVRTPALCITRIHALPGCAWLCSFVPPLPFLRSSLPALRSRTGHNRAVIAPLGQWGRFDRQHVGVSAFLCALHQVKYHVSVAHPRSTSVSIKRARGISRTPSMRSLSLNRSHRLWARSIAPLAHPATSASPITIIRRIIAPLARRSFCSRREKT